MSRIRTVKPDFWTSEQVLSCSPLARLLFIGMWNFCDDSGIHPASYVRLKAEIFPGDDIAINKLREWIMELINNDLLHEYAIEGKSYWIVTGWRQHQRIDRPTYKFPLPSRALSVAANSTITPRSIANSSETPCCLVANDSQIIPSELGALSVTDRNGMDRNGKEKDIREAEASPLSLSENHSAVINAIFNHWKTRLNHPKAALDAKRKRKIEQALDQGYTEEDLMQAIDGCSRTEFNMGQNERKKKYDDIELILRDSSHIERFMQNATEVEMKQQYNSKESPLMDAI